MTRAAPAAVVDAGRHCFDEVICRPANLHPGQMRSEAPFFFAFLGVIIVFADFGRLRYGLETLPEAARKDRDLA